MQSDYENVYFWEGWGLGQQWQCNPIVKMHISGRGWGLGQQWQCDPIVKIYISEVGSGWRMAPTLFFTIGLHWCDIPNMKKWGPSALPSQKYTFS